MKQINIKKLLLLNLPYLLIGLFATKLGQAWRLAVGVDASTKLLHLPEGFAAAFQSFLPSLYPQDLVIGLPFAVILPRSLTIPRSATTTPSFPHRVSGKQTFRPCLPES